MEKENEVSVEHKGKRVEVICSNCGKKAVLENYVYGEPCRFCGYKRTGLLR